MFSSRVQESFKAMGSVYQFFSKYQSWVENAGDDGCDFAVGNPHEMPLPGFVEALEKAVPHKRDWLVSALRESGYDVHSPEGTFYLLPRSPLADDVTFLDLLAEERVFCLPGKVVEMPGYFRISLTATDDMIERAIPKFAAIAKRVQTDNG